MPKKWFSSFHKLIEKYQDYFIWGTVIFVLLIGLCLKSSNIILSITALIIFWYTLETYRMRKAISESTEISTRPVLILHITSNTKDQKVIFSIENFADFPAYNVRFEETEFNEEEFLANKESRSLLLDFKNVDLVPPKGKVEVSFEYLGVSDDQLFELLRSGGPRFYKYVLKTTITYEDIFGRNWKSNLGYGSEIGIIAGKPELIKGDSLKVSSD